LFGISLAELLFILVIALIVLGPERLPEVARTLAGWIRQIREASDDIQRTLMIEDQGSTDSENPLDRMMADQPIGDSGGSTESDAMSVPAIRPVALAPTRSDGGARSVELATANAPKEGHHIEEVLTPAPTLPW
jgi:Tat protein translocase TatB subunit